MGASSGTMARGARACHVRQACDKTVASNKGQMPAKKQVNSATNAPAPSTVALVEPIPPVAEALANAVLARVLQQVNLGGLRERVLDEAATRLARSVQVDELIERIVGQSERQLSAQLSELVIEHIALGAPKDAPTEGS